MVNGRPTKGGRLHHKNPLSARRNEKAKNATNPMNLESGAEEGREETRTLGCKLPSPPPVGKKKKKRTWTMPAYLFLRTWQKQLLPFNTSELPYRSHIAPSNAVATYPGSPPSRRWRVPSRSRRRGILTRSRIIENGRIFADEGRTTNDYDPRRGVGGWESGDFGEKDSFCFNTFDPMTCDC